MHAGGAASPTGMLEIVLFTNTKEPAYSYCSGYSGQLSATTTFSILMLRSVTAAVREEENPFPLADMHFSSIMQARHKVKAWISYRSDQKHQEYKDKFKQKELACGHVFSCALTRDRV